MARARATRVPLLGWTLVAAGLVYFAATIGVVGSGARSKGILLVAAVLLIELVRKADPAWLLSAGIVSTMFSGNWAALGLSSSIGPDRVILAAGLLAVLLRAPPARNRPRLRLTRVHFALAVALAYVVISAIFAGTLGRRTSEFGLLDQYGALPFVLFTVAPVAFASDHQRRILLGCLVGAGLYLSVTAIFEKLQLYGLVFPSYITDPAIGDHFGRARGPFVEAGAEGLALFACSIAAALSYPLWRERWQRGTSAAVVLLGPVGMVLTVTRAVWLAGIVGTLVALLTTARLRRYLVPVAAAGACVVVGALTFIPGLSAQAQQRQSDQAPIWERQNTDAAALRMVAARPLLGFGWDRADERIDPYFRLDPNIPLTGETAGFHNLYLQYAVTLGLVGFAVWLVAGALAFGSAIMRRGPGLWPWQAGLKAILAAWMVVGLSSPASYVFSTIVLWTWAGITYGRPLPAAPAGTTSRNPHSGDVRHALAG